jgi:glucokinase
MTQRLAAGIDIGGTNTKFGLVDRAGKIVFRDHVDTGAFAQAEAFADAVVAGIRAGLDGAALVGIGIGAPNGNFFSGSIEQAPNLAWKGIVPMARFFEARAGVRTLLTNDANAAALGEMLFGAARGMRDFIFMTFGTGVGSGIVVNGALVYGHDGFAGEIGHVIVEPAGRPCGCGRRGCLEQYASAGGLVATYRERTGDRTTPVTAREVAERARAGEAAAVEAFRETGDLLGLALANSVAYTSPAAIFLFGGLTEAGDVLLDPLRLSFHDNLLGIYRGKVDIRLSGLSGADAAILGAASLVWDGEAP